MNMCKYLILYDFEYQKINKVKKENCKEKGETTNLAMLLFSFTNEEFDLI